MVPNGAHGATAGARDYAGRMALVLLIRHAVTEQTGKRLYGRAPGNHLSARGRRQAEALAEHLADVPLEAVYASPLERCRETASPILRGRKLRLRTVAALNEVDYGRWTGRTFGQLRRTREWRRVRSSPASVRFPGGETLHEVQQRAVRALQEIAERHGEGVAAAVSHGDVVRLALAHYAGIHLDLFQRLEVWPASVTAVEIGDGHPRILRMNDTGDLSAVVPERARRGKVAG